MKRPLCCCDGTLYDANAMRHLIEAHGIIPARAPQLGDVVYPLPQFCDPTWYVVARVKKTVRCRGCSVLMEKGELNASQQWNSAHYCLGTCAGWFGTPADQEERKHIFLASNVAPQQPAIATA